MITHGGITAIEKAFYEMGKGDTKLQKYFFTYYSQKLLLLNHFYTHVEAKLPGYPDHGSGHITRIMEHYEKMLKNNIPSLPDSPSVPSGTALNFYEIYLLLCATLWHDVGNLLGRYQHNEEIAPMLERIERRLKNNFFVDDVVKEYSLQLAEAHTGDDGVRKKIKLEDTDYKNEEINLRFLGGLLRFADELEEGEVRVDRQFYETMKDRIPDNQRIYWETCLCIKRIEPKPDECRVVVHARINKRDLFKSLAKSERRIALIDELVFRVDKMNRERMYYMEFVRKHIEYREIVFDIVVENIEPIPITFIFNNTQGYNAFWKNHSEINPEEKIAGYNLQMEVEK